MLAAVAVVTQQAMTTYPSTQSGASAIWVVVSFALLWLVYRRSNVARTVFAGVAVIGFVLFASVAVGEWRAPALC